MQQQGTLCHNCFAMVFNMIALICLSLAILTSVENDPKHAGATYGFMMFAFVFGIPGIWLCIRGRKKWRYGQLLKQLSGFLKSHDTFSAADIANKIGKTEMQTESLIVQLIETEQLDILFHRPTRRYFHKNRIQKSYRQIDRCASCGASLKQEIVFANESSVCQYCGHTNSV